MRIKRIASVFLVASIFMLSYMAYSAYTSTMDGFAFDQVNGTFTCNMSNCTGMARGATAGSGTFVSTMIDGTTAHVFSSGSSSGTTYKFITFTSNMVVDFSTSTVATSSMTTTFKKTKNGAATQSTTVADGTYSAQDFSDLSMSATGN